MAPAAIHCDTSCPKIKNMYLFFIKSEAFIFKNQNVHKEYKCSSNGNTERKWDSLTLAVRVRCVLSRLRTRCHGADARETARAYEDGKSIRRMSICRARTIALDNLYILL